MVATTNRLIFNPVTYRVVINPSIYNLLFTSFASKRFAAQTRVVSGDDWLFLNFCYDDPSVHLQLDESDEHNRYSIQLYHRTATQVDLAGKKVLEVSCGHGGGASYLMRTQHPASYTGLDLNADGVAFCKKRHTLPGLDFVEGNALDLPFPDDSFDVVLNVEASHLYPDVPRFLAEAARVLAPGGHFLYADFRRRRDFAEWDAALANAPLRLLSKDVIDQHVLRGMEKDRPHKHELTSRHGAMTRFASDMTDWTFCRAVEEGEFSYRVYSFVKD
jgi:ubiquinone/menaquinone biosynthesis C-methylase UbiE